MFHLLVLLTDAFYLYYLFQGEVFILDTLNEIGLSL